MLCGAVCYEFNGESGQLLLCHCTFCQARSGSTFGMSLYLDADALRITEGDLKIYRRVGDSGRQAETGFCAECGTQIYGRPQWRPEMISLKPGTLDDRSWLKPEIHIWTKSKQPWVNLPDDIPCSEEQT